MILESLFGGLLGGVMRLAPELLKFFDRKDERKHELSMFTLQTDLEKVRGEFKVEEKYVDFSTAQLNTLAEAYKEQATAVSKAHQWVADLSALVRPAITYIVFGLYVAFKVSVVALGMSTGQPWLTVFGAWTEADTAMLNMIISYWFVNRTIEKYRS